MKRPIIIILSVITVFILLGTSMLYLLGPRVGNTFSTISNDLGYGGGGAPVEPPAMPEVGLAPVLEAPLPASADSFNREATSNIATQTQERLVIKNADLAIVVKDPETRMKEISAMAVEMGGFVVSSNLYQSFYGPSNIEVPEATITIRVPSEKLDEALTKIKEGSSDVQFENISGQDVTSQYVDLQSQLKAKQAAEKKLLEILDKAEKAEDVLAIYLQVQSVQTEIEILKGQIKYFEESAALSAVSVRLVAEEGTQPIEVGGWKIEGTARDAIQDLIGFLQGFVYFLIRFLLNYVWRILLIGLLFYAVFAAGRAVFRRFNRSKVVVEEKEETKK